MICPRCERGYDVHDEPDNGVCPSCHEELCHEMMQDEENFYNHNDCYQRGDDGFCDGFPR